MKFIKKSSLIFFTTVILYSCYRHNEGAMNTGITMLGSNVCDTTNVSYDSTIRPILLQNCALTGCHASSSATGGYTLDNYNGARSAVLSGRIIGAITHTAGYAQMPKDRPMLDECQVALITTWIGQGAQNN
jgi:hypothetical protein